MKFAIDIDDTLTRIDRVSAVEKYLKEKGLPFRIINPNAHALLALCDWSREDVTNFFTGGGGELFLKAPVRKGARETLLKWAAEGHEIIVLTARISEWFSDPVSESRKQLDENGIPYDEVVADVWEKGEYCLAHKVDVLIEDNFEICKKAQSLGVKAIMVLDKHNFEHGEEIAYTGSTWEEIAAAAEEIISDSERG